MASHVSAAGRAWMLETPLDEARVPEMSLREIGVIVIGRNEGDRLRRCLGALANHPGPVVYVDSASSDGSAEYARSQGFAVVELDESLPLNAARARNAGFEFLTNRTPPVPFVQFIDGDWHISSSSSFRESRNPAHRDQLLGLVAGTTEEEATNAVSTVCRANHSYRKSWYNVSTM